MEPMPTPTIHWYLDGGQPGQALRRVRCWDRARDAWADALVLVGPDPGDVRPIALLLTDSDPAAAFFTRFRPAENS